MYPGKTFGYPYQLDKLLEMLSEAIEMGLVEEIPNTWKGPGRFVRWFREKETGVVYALEEPNPPSTGSWRKLEPEEQFRDANFARPGGIPN
jgi:hypothetical protein